MLTLKQKLFVEKYLETRNAYESARAAGYSGNDATLRSVGSENLSKPDIRAEIDQRLRGRILSANQVLSELSDVAFAPWDKFLDIKYGEEGEVIHATLLLKDKLRALELVGKYHRLFTDKVEIGGMDLDAAVERELARVAAAGQDDVSGEAEGESVH